MRLSFTSTHFRDSLCRPSQRTGREAFSVYFSALQYIKSGRHISSKLFALPWISVRLLLLFHLCNTPPARPAVVEPAPMQRSCRRNVNNPRSTSWMMPRCTEGWANVDRTQEGLHLQTSTRQEIAIDCRRDLFPDARPVVSMLLWPESPHRPLLRYPELWSTGRAALQKMAVVSDEQ